MSQRFIIRPTIEEDAPGLSELLSDTPRTVVALDGYDLRIASQRPIFGE